jgi:hypothetical protein
MADVNPGLEILKSVITAAGSLGAAFWIARGAYKVGENINANIERHRAAAQFDLEKLKNDFQVEIEKQRQEFQRALDTDKQHMELYKTLFSARLTSAMKLSEFAGDLYILMTTRLHDMDAETMKNKVHPGVDRLANWRNTNDWLFSKEVNDAASAFISHAIDYTNAPDIRSRDRKVSEMGAAHREMSACIKEMMLSDDLSRLVKR